MGPNVGAIRYNSSNPLETPENIEKFLDTEMLIKNILVNHQRQELLTFPSISSGR